MRGGRDCRLKGGGQAQTLNMKKMLSFYEFMKEMLSFWKVILPKMRFRPTQTLKMKNMLSFCEFMKEMLSFWSGLGKHAGRERLQTEGWRPNANIENEGHVFILRIYEGNAFILESHTT